VVGRGREERETGDHRSWGGLLLLKSRREGGAPSSASPLRFSSPGEFVWMRNDLTGEQGGGGDVDIAAAASRG